MSATGQVLFEDPPFICLNMRHIIWISSISSIAFAALFPGKGHLGIAQHNACQMMSKDMLGLFHRPC